MNTTSQSVHAKYTAKLRRRRFCFFQELLAGMETPIRLLDCGGTVEFWQNSGVIHLLKNKIDITIVNIFEGSNIPAQFKWLVGDARDLGAFCDREFDVVFSNAVINLMPSWEDQVRMSRQILRVGKRYFVQSPNRYFPLDWRTLVPFFHFLPPEVQAWCFAHFRVGTYARVEDPAKAGFLAARVRDLSITQMQYLFPGCRIFRERFFGFTKSLTAYGGWS